MIIFNRYNFCRNILNRSTLLKATHKFAAFTEFIMARWIDIANIDVDNAYAYRMFDRKKINTHVACQTYLTSAIVIYPSCPSKIIFRLAYADDFH